MWRGVSVRLGVRRIAELARERTRARAATALQRCARGLAARKEAHAARLANAAAGILLARYRLSSDPPPLPPPREGPPPPPLVLSGHAATLTPY